MSDFLLREASNAEAATIVALIQSAFEEYRGKLDPPSSAHNETEETICQRMSSARVVLAVRGGEPNGCVFYQRAEDHLSLSRLAVLPAHRRRGIGQALVAYVEHRARALSLRGVQLGVRITPAAAGLLRAPWIPTGRALQS
jgi:ribosomal protein S18 acetylase RimI-like enzyme